MIGQQLPETEVFENIMVYTPLGDRFAVPAYQSLKQELLRS
jgi:hypothetical protein